MSARIPPGYAEVWFQFNLSADLEPMYSAIGVDVASGTPVDQASADAMLSVGHLALQAQLAPEYTLGPGFVIAGQDGGDVRIDGSATPINATASGNALPNNTAFLIRKVTATGGRRGRGRMFIPGPREATVDPTGIINTTDRNNLQTAMNNLRTNMIALASVDAVVLLHQTPPQTPDVITALTVQTRVATQRRRMRP